MPEEQGEDFVARQEHQQPVGIVEPHFAQALTSADLIVDSALKSRVDDKFGHGEIASTLAELVAHVEMPVNIALFGPWGSGKSSIYNLIKSELEQKDEASEEFPYVKAIKYDAWKFSGSPLKRNFIANAASELGLSPAKYHSDLYENTSSFEVPWEKLLGKKPKRRMLHVVASILLAILGLAAVLSVGSAILQWKPELVLSTFGTHLRSSWKFIAVVALPLIGGFGLLELAKVNVTRSAPREDEEFQKAFEKLMVDAMATVKHEIDGDGKPVKGSGRCWDRVLVFVDELDRCAPDDVLATLIGIKTFLEHPKCVFVVAADREVLVEALDRQDGGNLSLRQATPLREFEPYFSTAGAFLDKMFQHQIDIPPLRRHTLTRFARDVVKAQRGGLWTEFDDTQLEDVIYTLIPLHIRSPRRVKVLLNSFASTVRIADARRIKWKEQSSEIAKLTVLRTEFPRFAQDLQYEPKLVKHLEDGKPPEDDATSRLKALYENYVLGTHLEAKPVDDQTGGNEEPHDDATPASSREDAGEPANSNPIIGLRKPTETEAIRRTQITINKQLIDYLEKTKYADIRGPGRALLYLEIAGQKEGLIDGDLADVIDDASEHDPKTTVDAFAEAVVGDVQIGIEMLGSEIDQYVGPGRRSATETVCKLVQLLDDVDVAEIASTVTTEVLRAVVGPQGTPAMIPGALALVISKNGADQVISKLRQFVDGAEVDTELELEAIADLLPRLTSQHAELLSAVLSQAFGRGHTAGTLRTLSHGSNEVAETYWKRSAESLFEAIDSDFDEISERQGTGEVLAEDSEPDSPVPERLVDLLDALDARTTPILAVMIDALNRSIRGHNSAYPLVKERSDGLMPAPDLPHEQTELAVHALGEAPNADWKYWVDLITTGPVDPQTLTAVLGELIRCTDITDNADYELLPTAAQTFINLNEEPLHFGTDNLELVRARLLEGTWQTEATGLPLHQSIDKLLDQFHPEVEAEHAKIQANEVFRTTPVDADGKIAVTVLNYIKTLPALAIEHLNEQLDASVASNPASVRLLRIVIHSRLKEDKKRPLPVQVVLNLTGQPSNISLAASEWLRLLPDTPEVITLIEHDIEPTDDALISYAGQINDTGRTTLWSELGRLNKESKLRTSVAAHGVDQATVEHLFEDARNVDNSSLTQRSEATVELCTLPIHAGALMDEATITLEVLLASKFKGDTILASDIALAASNVTRGRKTPIKAAFDAKIGDLTTKRRAELSGIGFATAPKKPPKQKKKRGFFKAILGG